MKLIASVAPTALSLTLVAGMAAPALAQATAPAAPAASPSVSAAAPPAQSFTPVSDFSDVSPDNWAYQAIKELVEKYHVMGGFPDGTFRGTKYVTRYELASALDKVMHRVEQLTAQASGSVETLPAPPPGENTARPTVSPEDLRTIARLQQEFKDELDAMQARQDTFDQRLINLEKRVRVGGGLQIFLRSYTASEYGPNNLRVATHLKLDGDISPGLTYTGQLMLLNDGVQYFFNGHQAIDGGGGSSQSGDSATPLYIRKSFLSWTPPSVTIDAGMLNFSDILPVGSSIANGFDTGPIWPQGESGYGFVGTPPAQNGRIQLYNPAIATSQPDRAPYHPGVNVVQDLLDPNSAADLNNGSAGTAAVDAMLGPVELGAGINDGVPGASTGVALLNQPDTFPRISELNDGYSLAKVGIDLGVLRASAIAHVDNSALGQMASPGRQAGKGFGGTLDIGNDLAGLSLNYAEINRTAMAAATDANYYHEASLVLSSTSILGLGLGAGIAAKIGLAPISGFAEADPSIAQMGLTQGGKTKTPLIPYLPYNWASTGVYLKFPGFSIVPSLTLAYQTSGWDLMDSNFGSGLSAIAEIEPYPSLPHIFLEYDQGKFSSSLDKWNALFGTVNPDPTVPSAAAVTHEQFIVGTSVAF